MKGNFIILLLLFTNIYFARSQEESPLAVTQSDIVGRWEIETDNDSIRNGHPYLYLFREDSTFHRGEVSDGVILFNIAGRYRMMGDSVEIRYRDYMAEHAKDEQDKRMIFMIHSISDGRMDVTIQASRFNRINLCLRKQF